MTKKNNLSKAIQEFDWRSLRPRRIFHGRGQADTAYKSINIDWLPPVTLITLYQECDQQSLSNIAEQLHANAGENTKSVLLQRRYSKPVIFESLLGEKQDSLILEEYGLKYQLSFTSGMHTGLFLDMSVARNWIKSHAAGKRVLNLFAYTCAFSVAAAAGGAKSVVNIDLSSTSLNRGRNNHRLNQQDLNNITFLAHDILRSWGKLKRMGPYDLVVVDPPSHQPGSFVVNKDYARIIRRLPELLGAEADVLFCLNDPSRDSAFLVEQIAENADGFSFKKRLDNPAEFEDVDPERALKVLHYYYQSPNI